MLLFDTNTYKSLAKDKTCEHPEIVQEGWYHIIPENCIRHCIRALKSLLNCTVHSKFTRPNTPLSRIVSSCGSIRYDAARHIAYILSPLVCNTLHSMLSSQD